MNLSIMRKAAVVWNRLSALHVSSFLGSRRPMKPSTALAGADSRVLGNLRNGETKVMEGRRTRRAHRTIGPGYEALGKVFLVFLSCLLLLSHSFILSLFLSSYVLFTLSLSLLSFHSVLLGKPFAAGCGVTFLLFLSAPPRCPLYIPPEAFLLGQRRP